MRTVVAIDGPAGAGKSTVAKLVASKLGLVHIDTGATYRLVGLRALAEGVPLDDAAALASVARSVAASTTLGPQGDLRVDGRTAGEEIRTEAVGEAASRVAAHPGVREVMVAFQRTLVPPGGAVVEGRDIGTVVWPGADVKVYLDAEPQTRAARRSAEVASRDERDAGRPVGAMRPAPGALVIDTSRRSPEEIATEILGALNPHPLRPNPFYRFVRGACAGLLRGPFRLEVRGAGNIPPAGPAILAPNHRSLVDIPLLAALTRRKVWFMGKEELFSSKMGNRIFSALGAFPVRRGRPDRRALNRALELLRQGELIGVYPEGTRRPQARFEDVEDGLAYLALKSGAPIVPVALSGTESVFPKGRKLPKLVRIKALIGEAFSVGGPVEGIVPRARVHAATEEARKRLIETMQALEPPGGSGGEPPIHERGGSMSTAADPQSGAGGSGGEPPIHERGRGHADGGGPPEQTG